MAKGLMDYLTAQGEPPREPCAVDDAVEEAKAAILEALKRGTEPELILYKALDMIGSLTKDEAWTKEGRDILDRDYKDLSPRSLLLDEATSARRRMEEARRYADGKTLGDLRSVINDLFGITKGLSDAYRAVKALKGDSSSDAEQ